jgi:hypothetical protein
MTDIERELRETMRDRASQLVRTPLATRALMRRARRRRAGTVAVAGAVLMAVTFGGVTLGRSLLVEGTIEPADRPQPPSTAGPGRVGFIGLPPEGATPSSPISSELVLHYFGPDPAGWGKSNAWVYADGRLIVEREANIPEGANASSTGFLEQRLTSEGVETMRTYVVSHGEPVLGEPPDTMELRVRLGGRVVDLDPARAFDPDRLLEAESWLPESAWEDKRLRAYVPSEFAVCYDGGRQSIAPRRFVESLPAAAADLLRNKDWVPVMGMSTGGVSEVAEYCWVVSTDEAGTIVGALGRAGVLWGGSRSYVLDFVLEVRTSPEADPKEASIGFEPVLPNGDWTCSPCG